MAEPADTPVTVPFTSTVATEVLVLLHTPPGVASVSDVVYPLHTLVMPVIAVNGFTVIGNDTAHPAGSV